MDTLNSYTYRTSFNLDLASQISRSAKIKWTISGLSQAADLVELSRQGDSIAEKEFKLPPRTGVKGEESLVFRAALAVTEKHASKPVDDTCVGLFLTLEEGADVALVDFSCRRSSNVHPDPLRWSGRRRIRRNVRWGKANLTTLKSLKESQARNGKLMFQLVMSVFAPIRASKRSCSVATVSSIPAKTMGQQLREDLSSADVGFLVQRRVKKKGGTGKEMEVRRIDVHRLVLSARSEVFSAMFGNAKNKEHQDKSVTIKDMTFRGAEDFIQMIYTDSCDAMKDECVDLKRLQELLQAVEKYQILPLKSVIAEKLFSIMDSDNLGKIVSMAEAYNLQQLVDLIVKELASPGTSFSHRCMKQASEDFKKRVLEAMGENEGEMESSDNDDNDDPMNSFENPWACGFDCGMEDSSSEYGYLLQSP